MKEIKQIIRQENLDRTIIQYIEDGEDKQSLVSDTSLTEDEKQVVTSFVDLFKEK